MPVQNGGVFGSSLGQNGSSLSGPPAMPKGGLPRQMVAESCSFLEAARKAKQQRQLAREKGSSVFGVFGSFAEASRGGVFGSSAGPNGLFGGCSSSFFGTSQAVSHTQMPPSSREDETTVAVKKVKKVAFRYPILNSPLPMILTSRILKEIPQSPHFLQLRCYSGMARKNLEAAWDLTFEEAVEQIHELRSPDFWALAGKLWKTIGELQSLGYNVFVVRRRVVELTDGMLKQNKRQNEIMALKVRAELHRLEKSRLVSVIRNLKAQARSVEDKMVESLVEAADKEKDMPEIENQIVDLASQPLKRRKLA